jgi:hypothetical protein
MEMKEVVLRMEEVQDMREQRKAQALIRGSRRRVKKARIVSPTPSETLREKDDEGENGDENGGGNGAGAGEGGNGARAGEGGNGAMSGA